MNLREGTRRLALLLGVAGALGGSFLSVLELQDTLQQRERHNKFEQLANSDVVQQERKFLSASTPAPRAWDANGNPIPASPFPSEVNKVGIRAITWGTNYTIVSIETDDGQTLYPSPSPSAWQYLFIALAPVVGFLIPWGVIRAIGWMLAGFVAPST